MKYTIKTVLNNVIQNKEGQITYNQKLVSMKWTESQERKKYTQSGTGPGEFGPDYSDRKKYQLGYGNESPSPILKEALKRRTKMACNNIDCHCVECTCDPCECSVDNPCGCDESSAYQGA